LAKRLSSAITFCTCCGNCGLELHQKLRGGDLWLAPAVRGKRGWCIFSARRACGIDGKRSSMRPSDMPHRLDKLAMATSPKASTKVFRRRLGGEPTARVHHRRARRAHGIVTHNPSLWHRPSKFPRKCWVGPKSRPTPHAEVEHHRPSCGWNRPVICGHRIDARWWVTVPMPSGAS